MRCSMLSRMKLHRAVNVAGIVKRKDSFTTVKITAAVKNSTPHNEADKWKGEESRNALLSFFLFHPWAQRAAIALYLGKT